MSFRFVSARCGRKEKLCVQESIGEGDVLVDPIRKTAWLKSHAEN
jgi:hypothetical protein